MLLIQRTREPWAGYWDIPGGFCDAGEHPIDAAVRELYEETGIRGYGGEVVGMWMDVYGDPQHDGLRETTLNVYVRVDIAPVQSPRLTTESSDAAWFRIADPPVDLAFPNQALPALATLERLISKG